MRELTVEANTKSIPTIIDLINEELDQLGCSPKSKAQIDIAVDEVFSNIANYAYGEEDGQVTVRLEAENNGQAVNLVFLDKGMPFNPLEHDDPNVLLPARERRSGGLGIYIVKNSMDEIRYEYKDGKNILTIRKTL